MFLFSYSFLFGLRCLFGGVGCGYSPGLRGCAFIISYMVSYVGGVYLVRYTEGATFLAIVQVRT